MIDLKEAENYFDLIVPGTMFESSSDDISEGGSVVRAPLITVVSASGGVGKSTIALLASMLASSSGIDTVLVEGDLQFGDMGFWLGLDDDLPTLGLGEGCAPIDILSGVSFYKAPCFPEVAEEVSDGLARYMSSIRTGRELVIADTGAFWSGLTAGLLLESDLFLLVMDRRPSSIVAAVKAGELCSRLGVPSTRMVPVYNRWSTRARVTADEARRALGADEVFCIPDGKAVVTELFSSGEVEELVISGNPIVHGLRELLASILPRVGRLYADAPIRHTGGLFR